MEVMLDLETLGTTPGSAILSIGAAAFDLSKGLQGRTFHAHLVLQTQLDIGMSVSGPTVMWWLKQDEMARHSQVSAKRIQPFEVLDAFGIWLKGTRVRDDEGIWSHGLNFDLPIIEALYFRLNIAPPWSYRAGRDTRTLFALAGKNMGDFDTPNAVAHDALADAIYQAHETSACYNYLRQQRIAASAMTEPVPTTSGDI